MCESIHDGKYGFTLFWFATSHIFICRHVDGLMLISRSTVEVSIDPLQLIFAITYNNTQYKNYVHVLAIGSPDVQGVILGIEEVKPLALAIIS